MKQTKPLREIMLEVHEDRIKEIYEIHNCAKLAYDASSTDICVNGVPMYRYLYERLNDAAFIDKLMDIRRKRRQAILDAHSTHSLHTPEEILNVQFDYELLGLDHLIDTEQVNVLCNGLESEFERNLAHNILLAPASGRTFFEEINMKELEVVGYLLRASSPTTEESFFFEGKDFEYLLKHTATRTKLLRIILEHDTVVRELKQRYETLPATYKEYRSVTEVYSTLKEMRIEQMRRRAAASSILKRFEDKDKDYLRFVGEALDYNEDNRLLRSISFFHVMKDKSIPDRFYDIIARRKNGV